MATRRNHNHIYEMYRRVNRIVLSKCKCGSTKTDMIPNFTQEAAKKIDRLLEQKKEKD
jgi:hypothetical protein